MILLFIDENLTEEKDTLVISLKKAVADAIQNLANNDNQSEYKSVHSRRSSQR